MHLDLVKALSATSKQTSDMEPWICQTHPAQRTCLHAGHQQQTAPAAWQVAHSCTSQSTSPFRHCSHWITDGTMFRSNFSSTLVLNNIHTSPSDQHTTVQLITCQLGNTHPLLHCYSLTLSKVPTVLSPTVDSMNRNHTDTIPVCFTRIIIIIF